MPQAATRTLKSIKDLKDLRALRVSAAIDIQDLKDLKKNENRYFYRSAGACPPRSLAYPNDGEGQALALR